MRFVARALLAVLVLAIMGAAPPASAAATEEAEVLAFINAARAGNGLPRLRLETELVDEARAHTAAMLSEGEIFHSRPGDLARSTSGWQLLGENVGHGPDARAIHQAFMQSETHRSNVLGTYDGAAVGTGRSPDGRLFVTVLFIERAREDVIPASGGDELSSLVRAAAAFPPKAVAQAFTLLDTAVGAPRSWCGTAVTGTACID